MISGLEGAGSDLIGRSTQMMKHALENRLFPTPFGCEKRAPSLPRSQASLNSPSKSAQGIIIIRWRTSISSFRHGQAHSIVFRPTKPVFGNSESLIPKTKWNYRCQQRGTIVVKCMCIQLLCRSSFVSWLFPSIADTSVCCLGAHLAHSQK